MELRFVSRISLKDKEWNEQTKQWDRPKVDHETLQRLNQRSNTTDQRLCTRGVKVSPITAFFYGGLDAHVEHHLFQGVPSRNLTRLREAMDMTIPERRNVIACWREILAIAKHRETHGDAVFVPAGYPAPPERA